MYSLLSKRLAPWIIRIGLLALILSLGLLGSPARPAAAAGIIVTAKPVRSGLEFSATSPSAVTWDVWLSTASIDQSVYPPKFVSGGTLSPRIKHLASTTAQTSFSPAFYNLLANTNYNYIVRGGTSYQTGSAKTLQRQRTITFSQIDVIGDSDLVGAGELTFNFYVDGKSRFTTGEISAGSHTSVYPNKIFVDFPSGATTTLKVVGIDDDCEFGQFCTGGIPSSGGGSTSDMDWATAESGVINAEGLPLVATFETNEYALKFKVYAKVEMRYF
jgi:hypothetical protein